MTLQKVHELDRGPNLNPGSSLLMQTAGMYAVNMRKLMLAM